MAKEKVFTSKFIAGVGILTAVEIVLYLIGTAIMSSTGVNVNLGLIPIVLGAIFYGPLCGLFLGFVNSAAVLLTPSNWVFFDTTTFGSLCIIGTPIICILKSSLAGLASGYVYRALKKNEIIAIIVASLIVPILNTGIFIGGAAIFYASQFKALIISILTFNILVEVGTVAVLSPAIVRIVKIEGSRMGLNNNVESGENENEEK